jgi:hypothetical protein
MQNAFNRARSSIGSSTACTLPTNTARLGKWQTPPPAVSRGMYFIVVVVEPGAYSASNTTLGLEWRVLTWSTATYFPKEQSKSQGPLRTYLKQSPFRPYLKHAHFVFTSKQP